ncbi:hypothetical protein F4813DRAFT_196063 [Daldinia decipiens]|uniref:uncharacterized protein n=1 Tax=Daldinia decipiens TaxID=326647 RepID=UPI0020C30AD0|nr:uncharacterized protein F4813DRAFT_196063 [Daldinia decipiens]KAI1654801.1 hypothetical protein F4813DRAFT_196063 [Daldinia decipiens]
MRSSPVVYLHLLLYLAVIQAQILLGIVCQVCTGSVIGIVGWTTEIPEIKPILKTRDGNGEKKEGQKRKAQKRLAVKELNAIPQGYATLVPRM